MSIRVYKRRHAKKATWTASVSVRGVTEPKRPHTRGGFATRELAEQYARAKEKESLDRLEGVPKLKSIGFEKFSEQYLKTCKKNNTPRYFASKRSVVSMA